MDWDDYNDKTKPVMYFLRKVYQDNPHEMLSLECAHAEEDLDILIGALEEIQNRISGMIKSLKDIKQL